MSVVQIIFSPTGRTRRAAEIIAAELRTVGAVVDLTDAGADFSSVTLNKDDVAIIAAPSFAGRVPALAAPRLAQIRGGGAACVALCVYGNRAYEDTLLELSDAASRCGFRVAAGVAAVAEHSVVRAYAAGRPDEKDVETLKSFAREIAAKIRRGVDGGVPAMPGNRPYKELSGGGTLVPRAGEGCVRCGLCAQRCPAHAISAEDPSVTDAGKCVSCMRCVSVCPRSARAVDANIISAVALKLRDACSVRKEPELFI